MMVRLGKLTQVLRWAFMQYLRLSIHSASLNIQIVDTITHHGLRP